MIPYERSVFINCPFDAHYRPLFNAILFAVQRCGFVLRCTLEDVDTGSVRLDKITRLIKESRFGVHDLSRVELDEVHGLPRMNMPLELGLFIGGMRYGGKRDRQKSCLILEKDRYRYQTFISDIAGQDLKAHNNEPQKAIAAVRDWLQSQNRDVRLPGGKAIYDEYREFCAHEERIFQDRRVELEEATFLDRSIAISNWLLNRHI